MFATVEPPITVIGKPACSINHLNKGLKAAGATTMFAPPSACRNVLFLLIAHLPLQDVADSAPLPDVVC